MTDVNIILTNWKIKNKMHDALKHAHRRWLCNCGLNSTQPTFDFNCKWSSCQQKAAGIFADKVSGIHKLFFLQACNTTSPQGKSLKVQDWESRSKCGYAELLYLLTSHSLQNITYVLLFFTNIQTLSLSLSLSLSSLSFFFFFFWWLHFVVSPFRTLQTIIHCEKWT